MTAPRWITAALNAVNESNRGPGIGVDVDYEAVAAALIERLPIDAMTGAIRKRIAGTAGITGDWIGAIAGLAVAGAVNELTEGDPEVVQLTELYQSASRALDAAGVPYATAIGELGSTITVGPAEALDLAGRIRWLAQQRPTRIDLQRAEAERDNARREFHIEKGLVAELEERLVKTETERDDARAHLAEMTRDRDYWQALAEVRAAALLP